MAKEPASKLEQKEIARKIGRRFADARMLNNLTQKDAAVKLGYANSSKLAKIENGTYENTIPHWTIIRASNIYDVSIDYLYGMTDDWERDIEIVKNNSVTRFVEGTFVNQCAQISNTMIALNNKLDRVFRIAQFVTTTTLNFRKRFMRYVELNPEFLDSPGGSLITLSLDEMEAQVCRMKNEYHRLDNQINGKALEAAANKYNMNYSVFDIYIEVLND